MLKDRRIRFLKNKDGSEYTGGVKRDLPDGFGILTDSRSNEFKCEWTQGQIDGMAFIRYKDGRQFIGNFIKGKKYGLGALSYNGKIYLGEFQESKRTGYGEVLEIALSSDSVRLDLDQEDLRKLDSNPRDFDMTMASGLVKRPKEVVLKKIHDYRSGSINDTIVSIGDGNLSNSSSSPIKNSKMMLDDLLDYDFSQPGIIIHSKRGYFLNGRLKGYGEFKIPNNDYYYFGMFRDGNFEGSGLEKTPEDSYHGKFINGLREGIGSAESKIKQSSYSGCWFRGMRDGFGILDQGSSTYEGFFKRSRRHGYAKLTKATRDYYFIGKFQRGVRSDFGKFENKGNIYIGEYETGKKSGYGYEKRIGKYTYIGDWKDGRKDGLGYEVTEFDEYKGDFLLGKRHGRGVVKFKGKAPFSCCYHDGELRERTVEDMSNVLSQFSKERIDDYFNNCNDRLQRIQSIISNSKANLQSELSMIRKSFKEESQLLEDKIKFFKNEFQGIVAGFKILYKNFENHCLRCTPGSSMIAPNVGRSQNLDHSIENRVGWEPMQFAPSQITKSQVMRKELSRSEFLGLGELQRKSSKNLHQFMQFNKRESMPVFNSESKQHSISSSKDPVKKRKKKKRRRKRRRGRNGKSKSKSRGKSIYSRSRFSSSSQPSSYTLSQGSYHNSTSKRSPSMEGGNLSQKKPKLKYSNAKSHLRESQGKKFDTFFNQDMLNNMVDRVHINPQVHQNEMRDSSISSFKQGRAFTPQKKSQTRPSRMVPSASTTKNRSSVGRKDTSTERKFAVLRNMRTSTVSSPNLEGYKFTQQPQQRVPTIKKWQNVSSGKRSNTSRSNKKQSSIRKANYHLEDKQAAYNIAYKQSPRGTKPSQNVFNRSPTNQLKSSNIVRSQQKYSNRSVSPRKLTRDNSIVVIKEKSSIGTMGSKSPEKEVDNSLCISPITTKSNLSHSKLSIFPRGQKSKELDKSQNPNFIMNYSSRNTFQSLSKKEDSTKFISNDYKSGKGYSEIQEESTEITFTGDFYLDMQGYQYFSHLNELIVLAGERGIAIFAQAQNSNFAKERKDPLSDEREPMSSLNIPIGGLECWFSRELIVCVEERTKDLLLFNFNLDLIKTIKTHYDAKDYINDPVKLQIEGNIAIMSSASLIKLVDLKSSKVKRIQHFFNLKSSPSTPVALVPELDDQKLMGYSRSHLTGLIYTHFLDDQSNIFNSKKILDLSDRYSLCHKVQCAQRLTSNFILLGGASTYKKGQEMPFLLLTTFDSSNVPISGSIVDDIPNSSSIHDINVVKVKNSKNDFKVIALAVGWIFVFYIENHTVFEIGRIEVDSTLPSMSQFFIGNHLYVKYPSTNVITVFGVNIDNGQMTQNTSYRDLGQNFKIENLYVNSRRLLQDRLVGVGEDTKAFKLDRKNLKNLVMKKFKVGSDVFEVVDQLGIGSVKGIHHKFSRNYFKNFGGDELKNLICFDVLEDGRILKVTNGGPEALKIGDFGLPLNPQIPVKFIDFNRKLNMLYFILESGTLCIINTKENMIKVIENFERNLQLKKIKAITSNQSSEKIFVVVENLQNPEKPTTEFLIYDLKLGFYRHKFAHLLDTCSDCEIDFYQEKIFVIGKKQNFSVLACFNFDKDLLFVSDFMKVGEDFKQIERIPGTNTLILLLESNIHFINFLEDNFKNSLHFTLEPDLTENIFLDDFEIVCKMKNDSQHLTILSLPFSDLGITKRELARRESLEKGQKGQGGFKGMKFSEFRKNIMEGSISMETSFSASVSKNSQKIKSKIIMADSSVKQSRVMVSSSQFKEAKGVLQDVQTPQNMPKNSMTVSSKLPGSQMLVSRNLSGYIENKNEVSPETDILLKSYNASNWNTLGAVLPKEPSPKKSPNKSSRKPTPRETKVLMSQPLNRSFELQTSPSKRESKKGKEATQIEYINSMRPSNIKSRSDSTIMGKSMWFKDIFVESYRGKEANEFLKIEISGNGNLVYLMTHKLDLHLIDLEKDQNENTHGEWDLKSSKISTCKIYNFYCVGDNLCIAYCIKQSFIRIFKEGKLVNVLDTMTYFQSHANMRSPSSTIDIPLYKNEWGKISRIFYNPTKAKRSNIGVSLNNSMVNSVMDSEFNIANFGNSSNGILWLESVYGVRYTNFNERDLDLQPGELLKLWKIQVPEAPRPENLVLKFVLDIPEVSKIIGLGVCKETKNQYLQILDILRFSPQTVILNNIKEFRACSVSNAIFLKNTKSGVIVVFSGLKRYDKVTKGFISSLMIGHSNLTPELKVVDFLEFNEYKHLNNIKNYQDRQFFVCAEWDILLMEIDANGRSSVLRVINDVSDGEIYDVFFFMDSLYAVAEGKNRELFKRVCFPMLRV